MTLYCMGDTHGDETRMSYRRFPELRQIKEKDFLFILGDFGCVWDYKYPSKQDAYKLKQINDKPWTTIVITGNHENYDIIEKMPLIKKWNGFVRKCVYNNIEYNHIFFIDEITILDIEEEHILCIPHAESHDTWNLLNPFDPDFKEKKYKLKKDNQWFRVVGQSWWPQEKMNVDICMDYMDKHDKEHFDLILSHDAPSTINQWFSPGLGRYKSTEGERYLEMLRKMLDFDAWFHGHYHKDMVWPEYYDNRICVVYFDTIQLNNYEE